MGVLAIRLWFECTLAKALRRGAPDKSARVAEAAPHISWNWSVQNITFAVNVPPSSSRTWPPAQTSGTAIDPS